MRQAGWRTREMLDPPRRMRRRRTPRSMAAPTNRRSRLATRSAYRPFTEFANGQNPIAFCGYTTWTLPAGQEIYQNMSFQTSNNTAFFYIEDETSGVVHSCSRTPYSGWHWDQNTAEWEIEAPTGTAVNFHSVSWSDVMTELYSNGAWV